MLLGLAGCSSSDGGSQAPPSTLPAPSTSPPATTGGTATNGNPPSLAVGRTVAAGLDVPWGMAFLSGGDALVAERDTGQVLRVSDSGQANAVGTVPHVRAAGEGGLLGLAVAPGADRAVYVYFTSDAGDNRVGRMTFDGTRLGALTVLLKGIPAGPIHNGGRIVVGPDGNLWIGTGESGNRPLAQDRESLGGKILRMTTSGRVPDGNPFPDSLVWSYGHRNVQGLAFDSTGQLWAAEFGQNTWDELNKVQRGGNHGWPEVEGVGDRPGFVDPEVVWHTDEASPSGLAIKDDVAYVAGLRGQRLWQVPVRGGRAGTPRAWFSGDYGRLRTVQVTPAGKLWLTTSNTDGRGRPGAEDDRILEVELS
jgi:glucose/arabinose dehydrogenase